MFSKISLTGLLTFISLLFTHQVSLAQGQIGINMEYDAGGKIFVENCGATTGKVTFSFGTQQIERRYEVRYTGTA
ncbi:MAG TPA: hypothetical protein PLR22_11485, partial [Saprospiraceae bacterium]|nr:hypothetical protein [Saprospiraceae bacterium]